MSIKNIFISHIHEDDSGTDDVKTLLQRSNYEVRDASINSDKPNNASDPEYIKRDVLAPRINWAGACVVYISKETKRSEWVNWEIEYAQKCDKRIVGIWEEGATGEDIPEALDKYADAVVGWRGDRVIDALEGRINNWEPAPGEDLQERSIVRISCQT